MRHRTQVFLIATLMLLTVTSVSAQDPSGEERLASFDDGVATIDVSSYPEEMQQNYQVFAAKCSQCHTLARPINSDYALSAEWSRYVKRMMRKPGSGITPKDGKAIFEFLVYDSSVRKEELIREKEQAATND